MKITAPRADLLSELRVASGFAAKGASVSPALTHVRLEVVRGDVQVSATDSEVAYISTVRAECTPGGVAVPISELVRGLAAMRGETVEIEHRKGRSSVDLTSGKTSYRLPCLPLDECPALPAVDADSPMVFTVDALLRAIAATKHTIAVAPRYGLDGLHLHEDSGLCRFVSTDGHALSTTAVEYSGEWSVPVDALLSPRALERVVASLSGLQGSALVEVAWSGGSVVLRVAGSAVWLRTVAGVFVDYQAIVPAPSTDSTSATVCRADLIGALKRIDVVTHKQSQAPVAVTFAEGAIELAAKDIARNASCDDEVEAVVENPGLTIGFSSRLLHTLLDCATGPTVRIEVTSTRSPALVLDPEDEQSRWVIMPMRLD